MTADAELLIRAVNEAARLLEADGAMIYLLDEETGQLHFAHDAGIRDATAQRLIRGMVLPLGTGMFGTAVARAELTITDDYPNDERFVHVPLADEVVELAQMRSMAVAPLLVQGAPIGAMGAFSSRVAAFPEAQVALLRALADHAAAAIGNQRLLARLADSEARYRALVEGSPDVIWATDAAGNLTFLSETVEQLTGWTAAELQGRHWSFIVAEEDREPFQGTWRAAQADRLAERRAGFRVNRRDGKTVIVELRGREELVDGRSAGAHGSMRDITAIHELQESLRARTNELARRVETQSTLQGIAAQITAIRDPDGVLQAAVDAAQRLLGSDGAHLTLRDAEEPILRPHVMAGGMDTDTRDWLQGQEFPIGGGMNGLAAELDAAVWTADYLVDPRIPHAADDQQVAERMGLRAMAVAPLRAPGGAVFGTLAISYREPRELRPEDVELLQGLADICAIAIANARLNDQLTESEQLARQLYQQQLESERRYRYLVDHSPDLVWSVDAEGRFTYIGESVERITGHRPEELLGRHWEVLSEPTTAHIARAGWQAIVERPEEDQQLRIMLPLAGGGAIPAEINMIGTTVGGRFGGAHGSIRDVRERERLEADLRRRSAELAATEERANLARELHDSVTQALFSMGLTLRALELQLDRDPAAARDKVGELRQLQKDALAEMRNLIFELRPGALESDGLGQALRTHAAAVEGRTGLAVSVACDLEQRLPPDVEEALYRIAQEALHNVVKHANATTARIALGRSGRGVRLAVEDDGIGFDPDSMPRGHLGLIGMQQRAERMGAQIEVGRRPAGGTRVQVLLPLDELVSAQ